jgi:hypothetical protein
MGFQFTQGGGQHFPSWTAPDTRFTWEGRVPEYNNQPITDGLIGDAYWGTQPGGYSTQQWVQDMGALANSIPNAQQAGLDSRIINADELNNATGQTSGIAGASYLGANQNNWINSLAPQLFQSADEFAQRVNQGAQGFHAGLNDAWSNTATANQILGNVMDPTAYNPLYQNAAALLTPQVRSSFSARGLGSSGEAINQEDIQKQQLADSFANRQFQEQLGAQQQQTGAVGQYAPLAGGLGSLGVASAQVPGEVYNQFLQGGLVNQQAYNLAQQNQLYPMQSLALGMQNYNNALDIPLNYETALYNATRAPQLSLLGALSGTNQSSHGPSFGKS